MEHLWSRADATGGNRRQRQGARNPLNYLRTVATGCHRLLPSQHGKEGVSGSSPEEGSAEAPQRGPAPVGRRPAFVTAQAASATRGVTSGKSITGCATRLK